MISDDVIKHYNQLVRTSTNQSLSTSEKDKIIQHGTKAESLLNNPDFAMFIHQYKFSIIDQLGSIVSHDQDSNARRVALANQVTGIDHFVSTLQKAVFQKNKMVSSMNQTSQIDSNTPSNITKEIFKV